MAGRSASLAQGRRRRILAIASATTFDAAPQSAISTLETRTVASPTALPSADFERLREMLEDTLPRTWVFAGDSLGYEVAQAKRSYPEHVGDFLRNTYGRKLDVLIDVTISQSSLRNVQESAEWRLAKYQPDVVCVMPGLSDVREGQAGLRAFADSIRRLAEFLRDEGTLLILMTPPLNLAAAFEPNRDLPAYIVVMRELAQSLGLILIDHWRYWHIARKSKPIEKWISPDGSQVLQEGHRRMARFILRSFGVMPDK